MSTSSWQFVRRPRWVATHVLVVALVAAMIGAGFWQLDRLQSKRDANDRIEARSEQAPVPFAELAGQEPEAIEYRPVVLEGTYLPDGQVRVGNRSDEGLAGDWVVTPMELDSGRVVAVNRGFVPKRSLFEPDTWRAPDGVQQLEGVVLESESGGRFATDEEALDVAGPVISRLDTGAIGDEIGLDLGDVYVQLRADGEVPADELPSAVPTPELDEGPHLSYAVQWFLFATIGVVGYAVLLARVARGDASRGDVAPGWES